MTQPRKEQVKNLKTKYTRFTGVGSLSVGGGPVQTVSNTGLEAFYDNFLSVTKTGTVGGAETSAPAILYGGNGPFSLGAGASFTLSIPTVNSGAAVTVTVQAGDVVTLGGSPVVTTSRMADRINQTFFSAGSAGPVADNVNGQLVLKSVGSSGLLTGDASVMVLGEVTPGILSTLGFSSLSSVTATGTTAPRRGVITVSADGLGGTVQLRKLDTMVPDAVSTAMRHALAGVYVPDVSHGQPTYARLTAFPGPLLNGRNVKFSFFRNGPLRPRVVTSQGVAKSNFATLTGGDTTTVALVFGNGQSLNFNVTYSGITTVQGVVDKLNAAYSAASLAATGNQIDSTLATVVCRLSGPYRFTDPTKKDSFFVSFNGNTPVHVNPPAGIYSAAQLASYIAGRISAFGQSGQGAAFVYTDPAGGVYLALKSLNTDVTASSLRVFPGNPGLSSPGQYMETLDMLGLSPGTFRPGTLAQLYGSDEVEIACPSPLPGATLTISGGTVTLNKLGLSGNVFATASTGVQPVVAPSSHALIPEMMEFHEESDDYDSVVQDFDNKSLYNQLNPADGTANVGLDQLLGPDGKISPSILPRILSFLGASQLDLGSGLVNTLLGSTLTPKVTARHDLFGSGFYNLLFESSPDIGTNSPTLNSIVRIYTMQGRVYITVNAKVTAAANASAPWARDTTANSYVFRLAAGTLTLGVHRSTDAATWNENGWDSNVVADPSTDSSTYEEILSLGAALVRTEDEQTRPRIGTPIASGSMHLIYQGRGDQNTSKVRIYVKIGEPSEGDFSETGAFFITVNARWQSNSWFKDTSGVPASAFYLKEGAFGIRSQKAADDASWSDWEGEPITGFLSDDGVTFGGTIGVTGSPENPGVPAISSYRWTSNGTNLRTLLFESPNGGPYANCPVRIYMNHSPSFYGQGFEFTFNARWNHQLNRWYADDFGQKSYSWVMGVDRFWFLSKNLSGVEWTEAPSGGWDRYSTFDHKNDPGYTPAHAIRDGVFRIEAAGSVANPAPSFAVQSNTLYAKNMIKSWGKVRGDGPSITNVTLLDGFNCNFTGYDGGAGAFGIQFATAMANTHYAVQFSGRASNGGNPPVEPGSYYVWSGTKLSLYSAALIGQANYGFSYYPLTAQNGKTDAFLGTIIGQFMYFTVVGTQT